MAAPAHGQLCGAPLSTAHKTCQRKGRPCGIAAHVAYWKAAAAAQPSFKGEAGAEAVEEDDEDDDDDDASSVVSADDVAQGGQSWSDEEQEEEEKEEEVEWMESPAGVLPVPFSPFDSSPGTTTSTAAAAPYLHSEEVRFTAQRLLAEYFSRPYDTALKKWCSDDWELAAPPGHSARIQRPNHGLVHTVRVAMAVPLALRLLLLAKKQSIQSVCARDVFCAQYMMLFAVVGRGNEMSWMQVTLLQERQRTKLGDIHAPHLYELFKEKGQRVLREHLQRFPPALLKLSKKEQDAWVKALDIGKPLLSDVFGQAMKLAHDADLMRCYKASEFADKVEEMGELLGKSGVITLCDYVCALNRVTGDRCWGYGGQVRSYNKPLFAQCSHSYVALLTALDSVPQPLQHLRFDADPYALEDAEGSGSSSDDNDDDNASVVSTSSSGLSSLIDQFHCRLKLKDAGDVSVYEQLRFAHSHIITTFRKTPSCVRCFYEDHALSHDIVMNAYTAPNLFKQLNLALCQRLKDTFVKMYSLLLCKAISDACHDDVPPVLWRGVGYSRELLSMYAQHVGRVIWLYSFTSTSRSRQVAQQWANKQAKARAEATPTLIELRVPAACRAGMADVAARSQYPKEQEVLLACNIGYRIDAVDIAAYRISLTVVDISKCGLGDLPRRLCGEHKKLAEAAKWVGEDEE